MTLARPAPITLERISLRQRDRALIIGGVDSGKSTLCDWLGLDFVHRYADVGGRRLILDSKPRYRAEFTARGLPAKRRYRQWSHGQFIPGSVVVDDPSELAAAWKMGARTVIAQCEGSRELTRLVMTANAFLRDSRRSRPQLCQVDETLDFYHSNGSPRGGDDTITQIARAGRERGTAGLFGSQRTHGLAATLMAELNRLYAFRVDYAADRKRFGEFGAPDFPNPAERHEFYYWWKGDYRRVWGPYKLTLPA
jgi:hypothetical protein